MTIHDEAWHRDGSVTRTTHHYVGCSSGDPDLSCIETREEWPDLTVISRTYVPKTMKEFLIMPDEQQILEEAARIADDPRSEGIFDWIFTQCEGETYDPERPADVAIYDRAADQLVMNGFSKEGAEQYLNQMFEAADNAEEGEAT